MSATITAPRRRGSQSGSIDTTPGAVYAVPPTPPSGVTTPRSTRGSPLCSNASRRRASSVDVAAPRRKHSLSEVEILPWICCMTPALAVMCLYGSVIFTVLFWEDAFFFITAVLTFLSMLWIGNMAIFSLVGARRLREGTHTDWHAKLEELQKQDPSVNDVMHIVVLPNYKENLSMMKDTLLNLARSPMAKNRMRIVLAMEQREGAPAREKAETLIAETSHLFADIFATFHPENIDGEVIGKSSNVQWAYREVVRQYGPILLGCDLSRIWVSVGDADTLWHPQFFSAMTYSGLTMPTHERAWTIWQSPVFLVRNLFTLPAVIRASAHATLIFELSQLTNQRVMPALSFSTYSMTLALLMHQEVDGWDPDVIAEDHHMFCKCYFATLWEQAQAKAARAVERQRAIEKGASLEELQPDVVIAPKMKTVPIYLPAVCYSVETPGYIDSMMARFTQARRHTQGIVELGYVLLQYFRLVKFTGVFGMSLGAHLRINSVALKMFMLHIVCTAQVLALMLASTMKLLPAAFVYLSSGGLGSLLHEHFTVVIATVFHSVTSLNGAQQALLTSLGNISGVAVLYTITAFVCLLDLVEGRYYEVMGTASYEIPPVAEGDETAEQDAPESEELSAGKDEKPHFVVGKVGLPAKIFAFFVIFIDVAIVGYSALMFYTVIPCIMASFSLLRRGTDFEYVVGAKPEFE